ncbi:MAG: PDZ domain-containing protein [Burkholderiaceae bacterium]|nr:PDZ domain-containing protein [Burkholderiaceae bacterium]
MKKIPTTAWMQACVALLLLAGWQHAAQAQDAPRAAPRVAPAAPPAAAQYSPRMKIYFNLRPYGANYGARLTQDPLPGSPLRQPQINLKAGDTITALDGLPLTSPLQLEQHHSQTSVTYLNVRTGRIRTLWAYLPPPGAGVGDEGVGGGPVPGMSLGIMAMPVQVNMPGVAPAPPGFPPSAWPTRSALRITAVTPGSPAARAKLRPGDTLLTAGQFSTRSTDDLQNALAQSGGVLPMTVMDRYGKVRSVTAYLGGAGVAPAPGTPVPFSAPGN